MEQGLPGFGICNLGAINLSLFANGWYDKEIEPTTFANQDLQEHIRSELLRFFDKEKAEFYLNLVKWEELEKVTRLGIRFQDAVIDSTYYPFPENEENQKAERRVGLGILGLHDILIYAGIEYGDEESEKFCDVLLGMIAEWSYLESVELAKENGPFAKFEADKYLQSGYMKIMEKYKPHVVEAIREHGVRNATLLTIAPTGTTGTMVGASTGCEPYFAWEYTRNSSLGQFQEKAKIIDDYLVNHPEFRLEADYSNLPSHFVAAMDLTPSAHVRVQASLQKWIDSSISKTCNAPSDYTVEDVKELYEYAYELDCKGITIYRDNSRDEQVLELNKKQEAKEEVLVEEIVETTTPKFKKNLRPDVLYGATYKKHTPQGTAYITINDDSEKHTAREIFVNVGKTGTDVFAANEALGRMITLYLAESPNPNKESKIVKHFSNIGGRNSVGFGPNKISSVPDAIAKALIEHSETFPMRNISEEELFFENLELHMPPEQETEEEKPERFAKEKSLRSYAKTKDECPKCHQMTLFRNGGCSECTACGHSEC